MTPEAKAQELVDKFREFADGTDSETDRYSPGVEKEKAKQCALIAVDEILNARPLYPNYVDWDDCGAAYQYWYEAQKEEALEFWQEVKQEIEKL
jgi:hypothetical protein